jgi:hypothetical protein
MVQIFGHFFTKCYAIKMSKMRFGLHCGRFFLFHKSIWSLCLPSPKKSHLSLSANTLFRESSLRNERQVGDTIWTGSRVTRWADFSPRGRLFTLASFFQMVENSPNFVLLFSWLKVCINFAEKSLGQHFLGDFFNRLIRSPWQKRLIVDV